MPPRRVCFPVCLVLACAGTLCAADPPVSPQQAEFFEKRVRPVLVENCFSCHGEKKQEAGLRLDSREALLKGADGGEVVVSGKPDESELLEAIRQTGDLKMPPKAKLSTEAIDAIAEWIKMGLPWPGTTIDKSGDAAHPAKSHWAFRPVHKPSPPPVTNASWPQTDVDRFILSRLEVLGLGPAPAANRRTLLRRASFDLTGLPPTPAEVTA